MTVYLLDEDTAFSDAQRRFALSEQAVALVHLRNKTFTLCGELSQVPLQQFMQLCQRILLCSDDAGSDSAAEDGRPVVISKQQELVEKTCRYILQHLHQPLTVDSISKAMNTNRNSLAKAFKQELDIGVSAWLRLQRMEKARRLLIETSLSIQEISLRLGYQSQANFSATFKSVFQQNPLRVRRRSG
ncbi:helix-turn-helix transcriptional regulator [Rheinheimera marina]|uniref:Helix-turn-helix transcriptional regulator n=1 Tax=Rheinheimera marina TaxID=1774958 RepID=A0ABV9JPL6_9GAMM